MACEANGSSPRGFTSSHSQCRDAWICAGFAEGKGTWRERKYFDGDGGVRRSDVRGKENAAGREAGGVFMWSSRDKPGL